MDITQVRVEVRSEVRLKGIASVVFDNCFAVKNLKVIENAEKRLVVFMPSKKVGEHAYADIAHPINREFREVLEKRVLEAYQQELASK